MWKTRGENKTTVYTQGQTGGTIKSGRKRTKDGSVNRDKNFQHKTGNCKLATRMNNIEAQKHQVCTEKKIKLIGKRNLSL